MQLLRRKLTSVFLDSWLRGPEGATFSWRAAPEKLPVETVRTNATMPRRLSIVAPLLTGG